MLMLCNTNILSPVLTGQAENLRLKTRVSALPRLSTCSLMASPLRSCTPSTSPMSRSVRFVERSRKQPSLSPYKSMPKRFYKHKTLLDEQVSPRQYFPRLNERFDVKHIKHDLNLGSLPDPDLYQLAVSQGRIILTKNVKDFRPLL